MPELPEVETVRRGLEGALQGATIAHVRLRRRDLRVPFPPDMPQALAGRRITKVGRRAKYLLLHMDSDNVLIAHLGMTGRFSVEKNAPAAYGKHDHAVFTLDDGRVAIFNDARRFGLMQLAQKKTLDNHPLLAKLGPEPLDAAFSPGYLKQALAGRLGPIKPALMDQALVVGVGNIYASEALFLAGIDPRKPAKSKASQAARLVEAIQRVLSDAIASGGSSLRDFLQVSGEAGYFQHRFQVYGKQGKPCVSCQTPIRQMKQAGRSTFWCPRCQK